MGFPSRARRRRVVPILPHSSRLRRTFPGDGVKGGWRRRPSSRPGDAGVFFGSAASSVRPPCSPPAPGAELVQVWFARYPVSEGLSQLLCHRLLTGGPGALARGRLRALAGRLGLSSRAHRRRARRLPWPRIALRREGRPRRDGARGCCCLRRAFLHAAPRRAVRGSTWSASRPGVLRQPLEVWLRRGVRARGPCLRAPPLRPPASWGRRGHQQRCERP